MKNKIEIVYGDSTYHTMNNSNLNKFEIIKFNTIFSIADLSNIDNFILTIHNEIFDEIEELSNYDFSKNMLKLDSLIKNNDVRIWCSHQESNSYILLCYLCDYLKDKNCHLYVIYSDEVNKDYYAPSIMNEFELETATAYEHLLTNEDIIDLSNTWNYIKHNECNLRIMRNNEVKLVNYDYFDDIILNTLKELGVCKVSKLVAYLLKDYDWFIDLIYVFLIDRLIKNNKIKLIEKDDKRYFNSIISL